MNVLVLYAHPNPNSFNALLNKKLVSILNANGHEVKLVDLYQLKFNAVASWDDFNLPKSSLSQQYFVAQGEALEQNAMAKYIIDQQDQISWADHLLFQFPLWWFGPPAILKGWFDRVFAKGFAYDAGKVFEDAMLYGKTASIITTTLSPEEAFTATGTHHPIESLLLPVHHTLKFVGIKTLKPLVFYGVNDLSTERVDAICKLMEQIGKTGE